MPDSELFKSGFGLVNGVTFNREVLMSVKVTEQMVVKYRIYRYKIELNFKIHPNLNISNLIDDISNKFNEPKIINSHYGNPYRCSINYDHCTVNHDILTVHCIGNAIRIYR